MLTCITWLSDNAPSKDSGCEVTSVTYRPGPLQWKNDPEGLCDGDRNRTANGRTTDQEAAAVCGLPKPDERQIKIWKDEFRALRGRDRRTRYEMGKRLTAIQSERAKAHIGTFTTVDLKELKIPIHTAYRLINFYKRIQLKVEANLLQFAKAQEKFSGVEDVEDYERHRADSEVDALNKVIDEEAARIEQMKKKPGSYAHDYRVSIHFANLSQTAR